MITATHKIAIHKKSGILLAACTIEKDINQAIFIRCVEDKSLEVPYDEDTLEYEVILFDDPTHSPPDGWHEVYSGSQMGRLPNNAQIAFTRNTSNVFIA
jgi:hypothetical protein